MTPNDGSKGFFASLFDFNFTSFITMKFLKVIYIILMVVVFLGGITAFFTALASGIGGVFVAIFIVPLGVLLYLVTIRIYLELLALLFRIGENTQAIRQSLGGSGGAGFAAYESPQSPPGGFSPGGYQPPQPPPTQQPSGPPSWVPQPQRPPEPPQQPPSSAPPGFPPQ